VDECAPLLDGAYGTAAQAAAERGGGESVAHFSVRAYFCFHYRIGSRGTAEHYATLPYEALFAGWALHHPDCWCTGVPLHHATEAACHRGQLTT